MNYDVKDLKIFVESTNIRNFRNEIYKQKENLIGDPMFNSVKFKDTIIDPKLGELYLITKKPIKKYYFNYKNVLGYGFSENMAVEPGIFSDTKQDVEFMFLVPVNKPQLTEFQYKSYNYVKQNFIDEFWTISENVANAINAILYRQHVIQDMEDGYDDVDIFDEQYISGIDICPDGKFIILVAFTNEDLITDGALLSVSLYDKSFKHLIDCQIYEMRD